MLLDVTCIYYSEFIVKQVTANANSK